MTSTSPSTVEANLVFVSVLEQDQYGDRDVQILLCSEGIPPSNDLLYIIA